MATLKELSEVVGGEVVGNPELEISRVSTIDQAREGDITFISNPKYAPKLKETGASAVIVPPGFELPGFSLLVVTNPYLAFAKILTYFHPLKREA